MLPGDFFNKLTFSQTPKKTLLKSVEQLQAEREMHESAWLAGMREHPEWSRSTLAREMPTEYNWLLRNHRVWLEKQHQRQLYPVNKVGS